MLHRKEVIRKFGVLRCFSWDLTAKNGKLNIHIVGNAILVSLPLRWLPFGLIICLSKGSGKRYMSVCPHENGERGDCKRNTSDSDQRKNVV